MPYPSQIITMAQNLIDESEDNPTTHKIEMYMLWNAILLHHFPFHLDYGVAYQSPITGSGKLEFLVVRVARESKHVVLVVGLSDSEDFTDDAVDSVEQELVEYIEECFEETEYPTIYGIVGLGTTWTALKINKADSKQPITLVPWYGTLVSNGPFLSLKAVADEIREMTGQVISPSSSNSSNSS